MIPVGDANPPKTIPYITLVLITINVLAATLQISPQYVELVRTFGFTPQNFNILTLFTSIFLHSGLLHLAVNMWFLWLFGDNVEDVLGKKYYIVFYFLAGACANLFHWMQIAGSDLTATPAIGASGVISAIMGVYVMLFPRARMCVLLFFFALGFSVNVSAAVFIGSWFVLQLFSQEYIGSTHVAYGAHIGGFLFGVVVGYFYKKTVKNEEFFLPEERKMEKFRTRLEAQEQRQAAVAKVTKSRSEEYISDIEAHMRADHMDDALRLYIEYEGSPLGGALREDSQKSIADALYERGDYLFGLQAYLRLLSYYPATKYRIDVFARLGLILSQQLESPHEGFAYLWQSLSQEGEIADSELREAARLELDRIVDLLNKTAIEEHAQQQSTFRYSIFAQLTDERMLNENKISRVLLSIGEVGGIHLGRKLRYNAQANLRVKDGIMLKGLTFQEAHLAVKKLQEIGIYVIMVNEHDAPRFTPAQYVSEISFDIDRLVLKTEGKENALGKDDIFFVTLGKISYTRLGPAKLLDIWHVGVYLPAMYLFRRVQWAKSEAMRQKHDRWKSMGCHMLLDIFTKDFRRMRVSNNSFPQFNDFVEQLSTFLDGSRVDERVKVYLVQRTWPGLSFKNVREYTDFALWSARLKWIYSRFV